MTNSTGVNVSVRETSDRIADDRVGLPLETRIEFNRAPLMRKEIVTKRVLDLFLAGTALVILSPLLALVCLGIKPHLFNVLSGQMSLVGPAH